MSDEFPPNDHTSREERASRKSEKDEPKKVVRRVTKGQAIQRKKPLRKRFVEVFTGDDNVGVFEYVMLDVLIPGVKDIIADVSTTAIERSLFPGDDRPRRHRSRGGGGGYTSYNRMRDSGRRDRRDRDDDRDRRSSRRDRGHEHKEYIVPTRVEADEVLDTMFECISKYDAVSKRDLLSMIGEPHNFTDEDWGWTDLRGARVHRVGRDGYLIDLPRPEPLD